MQPESLPDRLKRIAGRKALDGIDTFDPENPLHIDQAARHLLRRFRMDGDEQAFRLLIDLCEDKLMAVAEDAAQEAGLAMPVDELVVAYFTRLFADVRATGDVAHILMHASDWLGEQSEAWARDLALADIPAPGSTLSEDDGHGDAFRPLAGDDILSAIVKICFHRLDIQSRRLLRARDVAGLSVEEISRQYSLTTEETRQRIREARGRLDELVTRASEGPDP